MDSGQQQLWKTVIEEEVQGALDRAEGNNLTRKTCELFDLLPDGVLLVDTEGQVRYANGVGTRLFGTPRMQEVVGRSVWDFVDQRDRRAALARIKGMRLGEPLSLDEQRLVRLDGTTMPVETTSVVVPYEGRPAVLVFLRDLSATKQVEQALSRTRALFERVFHSSPTAILITEYPGGRIIDANDAWCRLTGIGFEDALGQRTSALHLWATDEEQAGLYALLKTSDVVHEHEMQIRTRAGEERTVLVSAQHMAVEAQPCLLLVMVDVTERQRTRQKLMEAKKHAEEMARLKSTFLMNITHEVRTPLTVVLGFTSILKQGIKAEYRRFVDIIERSGRRLLTMMEALIDLAQLEADTIDITMSRYNLRDVTVHAVSKLRSTAEDRDLSMDLRVDDAQVIVSVDQAILTRILNNLLDNAIKFTETGNVEVVVRGDSDKGYVDIRDTGVGIDEAFLAQIFEPFTQESGGMERTHQGNGLGLAVSLRLARRMGGTILAKSAKGAGSVFTVVLPRA